MHLYNEIEKFPAQWLRNLADAGHIDGPVTVDERSIADLTAADAADATQVHLFAGIGGWSHALKLAGWPAEQPVWTGSCPCQPVSVSTGERSGWPTPTTRDHKDGSYCPNVESNALLGRVVWTAGPLPTGLNASTEKPVAYRLNPNFSRWLMGFPVEWANCAPTAMPSSRKSRRSS